MNSTHKKNMFAQIPAFKFVQIFVFLTLKPLKCKEWGVERKKAKKECRANVIFV